jgi:hypothetical protein
MSNWNHKGLTITVDNNGRFVANLNDASFEAASLSEIRTAIDRGLVAAQVKRTVNLPVVGIIKTSRFGRNQIDKDSKVGSAILSGFSRSDRSLQFKGLKNGEKLVTVLADTPDNKALLTKWIAARINADRLDTLIAAREIGVTGYGRIEPGEYNKMLEGLEKLYEKSKEKGSSNAKKAS